MIPITLLLLLSFLATIQCYPCDGEYAWKCPNDTLCLEKKLEVCAPPPNNIPRCPNGGDYGEEHCNEQLCKEIGLHKCPFDPFYVHGDLDDTCRRCPNGASNDTDCSYYSSRNSYASCEWKNQKYYDKEDKACNGFSDCPNSHDELNCTDDQACKERTNGIRPLKCLNDDVCIEQGRE